MNYFKEVLDIEKCKELIKKTPEDEICILCPHYSINIQSKYFKEDIDDDDDFISCTCWNRINSYELNEDWNELEMELGQTLFVNDYDDLCCDPHGIHGE